MYLECRKGVMTLIATLFSLLNQQSSSTFGEIKMIPSLPVHFFDIWWWFHQKKVTHHWQFVDVFFSWLDPTCLDNKIFITSTIQQICVTHWFDGSNSNILIYFDGTIMKIKCATCHQRCDIFHLKSIELYLFKIHLLTNQ